MELQELAVKAILGQIRFDLVPRFPDVRGAMIERFSAELDMPQWGWGDDVVNLGNEERHVQYIAGGREVRMQVLRVEDARSEIEVASKFFSDAMEMMGATAATIRFVGARIYWAAAVDSFDDLRAWMVKQLGSETLTRIGAEVGTPLSDAGWIFEYAPTDPKHRLAVGPMTREQLLERVLPNAPPEDFPDAFLWVDLDRFYNDSEIAAADAPQRWRHAAGRNLEIAAAIGAVLTGESAIY